MVGAPSDPRSWRPQRFGRRGSRHVDDPIVEPLWTGLRVLAHVDGERVELLDAEGTAQSWPAIETRLAAAVAAGNAVLDGYLTSDAVGDGVGAYTGFEAEGLSVGGFTRRMFGLGGRRNRAAELAYALDRAGDRSPDPDSAVAFVAVDLLVVDDEPLLDVPLLERKRLLDAIVTEGELVRLGVHIRPPIAPWLATWRTLGFRSIAFKGVNSRYCPGEINDDWATAVIPPR